MMFNAIQGPLHRYIMTPLCVCTYIYVFIVLHLKMMSSHYTSSYTQASRFLHFHFLSLTYSVTHLLSVTSLPAHDYLREDTSRRGDCGSAPGHACPREGKGREENTKNQFGGKTRKRLCLCWLGSLGSRLQEVNFDFIAHTLLPGRRR